MEKFARVCSKTGKGMNEGFIVNEGEFYFKEESDLLEWLRGHNFITSEGKATKKFSNDELLEWAFNDEIYFWTTWDIESEDELFDKEGNIILI